MMANYDDIMDYIEGELEEIQLYNNDEDSIANACNMDNLRSLYDLPGDGVYDLLEDLYSMFG